MEEDRYLERYARHLARIPRKSSFWSPSASNLLPCLLLLSPIRAYGN